MVIKHYFELAFIILFSCLTLIAPTAFADAPRDTKTKISTDRSELIAGSSFKLMIEISTPRKLNKLDLKYNDLRNIFTVGNVAFEETKTEDINVYRWVIPLIRNKPGVVKVPSLPISSNLSTPSFELTIKKPEGINSQKFIKTQLRNNHLIVGQLAMYRVEIDILPDVRIDTVSEPFAENATITLLTERTINRAKPNTPFVYRTRIQEYKIIFDKPGVQTIKSPVITGYIGNNKNQFMQSGKDTNITVAPNKTKNLVSENLTAVVKWIPEDKDIAVGQPITRLITIKGTNNSLSQLPDIKLPYLDDFDSYEDKSNETEKLMKNKKLVSTKIIKHVFIPKKNHTTFALKDINIEWMNPNDGSIKTITIPGIRYSIDGFSFNDYIPTDPQQTYWLIVGIILFIIFLVVAYFCLVAYIRRQGIFAVIHLKVDRLGYWITFNRTWSNSDPFKSRRALLEWAQKRWSQYTIVGLNDIPFYKLAKEEIDALSQACWSSNPEQWKGGKLYKKILKYRNYEKPKPKHGINPYGLNGEIYETVTQKIK